MEEIPLVIIIVLYFCTCIGNIRVHEYNWAHEVVACIKHFNNEQLWKLEHWTTTSWRVHHVRGGSLTPRNIMLGGCFILVVGWTLASIPFVNHCILKCSMWGCSLVGCLYEQMFLIITLHICICKGGEILCNHNLYSTISF